MKPITIGLKLLCHPSSLAGLSALLIYFCWVAPEHDSFWLFAGRFVAVLLIYLAITNHAGLNDKSEPTEDMTGEERN